MNPLFDSALKNASGLDPYLIWGAYTQFRGTVRMPPNGTVVGNERIQFLIECTDAFAKTWRVTDPARPFSNEHGGSAAHRVSAGKVDGDGIYSASAAVGDVFSMLKDLGGVVKRIELSTARKAPQDSWSMKLRPGLTEPTPAKANNVLVIIDDGLAFLNQCFRREDGNTCVAWFWDQSVENTVFPTNSGGVLEMFSGAKPAPEWQPVYRFGYGRELDAKAINSLIGKLSSATTERQTYQRLGYSRVPRDLAHGTHVAGWATAGHEEDTDIIMVQLPPAVSWDTSGGGTAKHVCDALIYALDRVAPDANVVVNLSFGANAGPHDGSTLLECAIDSLIKTQQAKRSMAMTVPAGNQFNARCHAALTLGPHASAPLEWNIGRADPTESFCELWYPANAAVAVTLTSPKGDIIGPVRVDESRTNSISQTTCAVVHRKTAASGTGLSQVLLAVAPTQPLDKTSPAAPAGTWKIEITNTSNSDVTVNAWIQRDDGVLNGIYQSRQSYFSSTRVGLKDNEIDVATDPVKRAGTGNCIAHGQETIVVGGCFEDSGFINNYTAAKPETLGRVWPDVLAPCDANRMLGGLLGQATQSGVKVRMNGTSISAPQVANKIMGIFKTLPKTRISTHDLRAEIVNVSKKPLTAAPTELDNLRTGGGHL
jgi:Subtilase family